MKKQTPRIKNILKWSTIVFSVVGITGLTACTKYSPDNYTSSDMQQVSKVDHAVVKSVRQVDVSDPSLGLGTAAGGVGGAVIGAQAGSGKGAALAAVGGAVVGAVAGTVIEQKLSETTAFEYLLQKPNGEEVSLAQKQPTPFPVGTHVRIIYGVHARIVLDQ